MLKALAGFRAHQTHHCVTGSIRNVYTFHGYAVSEEMLLGLGSGVGFMYWHAKGTDPFYGARANFERPGVEGLEKTVGRRTGVRVPSFRTGRRATAEKAMLDMLAAGEPVAVYADMGFLPYFNFGEAFHFGGHMIVVAGYDLETRQTLVADRDGKLHPVALDDLMRARGSKFKPFPPQNAWYTFDFSASHAPLAPDIWQAIDDVVTGMLEPPISNMGVKGIRKAAERTRAWPKIMSVEQVRSACLNAFIYIDATGGTGGGAFRYMYGRFLNEAAATTDAPQLAEIGTEMKSIGDCWQQAAQIFKSANAAPDPGILLPDAANVVSAIADQEEVVWKRLQAIVQENKRVILLPEALGRGSGRFARPYSNEKGRGQRKVGNDLLSRRVAPQVPSALAGLTAGFGKGPGVPPPPQSPTTLRGPALFSTDDEVRF